MAELLGVEKLTSSFGLVTMCQGLSAFIGSPIAGIYHYVNVSILIKFSQKTSVFYLNYHNLSIKSYVLDVY